PGRGAAVPGGRRRLAGPTLPRAGRRDGRSRARPRPAARGGPRPDRRAHRPPGGRGRAPPFVTAVPAERMATHRVADPVARPAGGGGGLVLPPVYGARQPSRSTWSRSRCSAPYQKKRAWPAVSSLGRLLWVTVSVVAPSSSV